MDGPDILKHGGLAATAKRLLVVQALAASGGPLTPQELLAALGERLNRVTLYRILDLLVEHGLVTRHNAGERAFPLLPCARAPRGHAHFTCTRCGHTQCLDSRPLEAGFSELLAHFPMRVDSAEVRFGGICQGCLGN